MGRRMWRGRTAMAVLTATAATMTALGAASTSAAEPNAAAQPAASQLPGSATATPQDARQASAADSRVLSQRELTSGETETTVRIGPLTMNAHEQDDEHEGVRPMHGPDQPMHGTHTSLLAPMTPPCTNCYITGIQPDMNYEDGSSANVHTGAMLHHAVFFDRSKWDVTCGSWVSFAGRRIFATGNERTGGTLPDGYGVKFGFLPLTYTLVELMNTKPEPQEVYVDVTMTHVPAHTPGMQEVTPVWLDADNCGNSQHSVPKGESHTRWEWESTISGTLKGAGGHIHDGGQKITLTNKDTGETMCTSEAGYGTDPHYEGRIESMTTCLGQDLGKVRKGDTLEIDSVYHSNYAQDNAMSIMVAFIAENE